MIAAPAVDLLDGRCVQLVGGQPDAERVSLPDPVGVARGWRDRGFRVLHVVDLDAALERGGNLDLVSRIARDAPGELQVGGGIRDTGRARALLEAGVDRIIVGTRAIDDPAWCGELAETFPRRVIVAADVRDGRVLRRGWTEETALDVGSFLETLAELPLAGVLWTDVGREGRAQGIDADRAAAVLAATEHPVWVSGGVTTMEELRLLREGGAAGAVLGMALYTGVLDVDLVAKEFGG
ncbi:MAG: 1-(5-phosphoribosyl)-5-[(5-phosphoribosylamino)methylideneamino] imidazole-4-carboxamide isomerase [Gemmatimonadetes bacterium]|nr:1-(5-phosphoribosyl)-5-[(5-phosphoribosylamino)methylideneamino] imidazole-4-carboxamide isomerase [Gemmatimonadota bacterium]